MRDEDSTTERRRAMRADPIRLVTATLLGVALALAGCGLAETAVTGAAGAAAEAQAARSAQAQLEATTQAIDAAQKTADEQRESALKEAGQ
jgi:hypothetical protein